MKKIMSLFLALALILTMLPGAVLAEDAPNASIQVSKTQISAGDEITVTVSLDTAIENVMLAEFFVHYDTSLFTRGTATVGTALTGTQVSQKNVAVDGTELKNDGTDAPVQKFSINTFAYPSGNAGTVGTIATIAFTAKADITEETSAQFKLQYGMMQDSAFQDITVTTSGDTTVTVAPAAAEAAYTVSIPESKNAIAGETVVIPVTVGHTGSVATYNAFDMSFTYDATILQLSSTEIAGMTVTDNSGTVRVQGYGADRNVGTTPFSLSFTAVNAGTTNVTLTSAKVDISANAIDLDAPEATIVNGTTAVSISGYPVTLPEGFIGESVAEPRTDYTFTEPEDYYDYTVTVTVGGESVTPVDNGDGSYTIPGESVTGEIVVTATKTGKTFQVTLGTDMTGNATAQYMTDYTATLAEEDGYTYAVAVTIGGQTYTGYTVSQGVYTIPGEDIIGDIVFTVTKTKTPTQTYTVTFEGNGAGNILNPVYEAEAGAEYRFILQRAAGFNYTITATMGGEAVEAKLTFLQGSLMHYSIQNVSDDIVITVTRTPVLDIAVNPYVELDGKTVFLVTVKGTPGEGKAYSYDGETMFYSEVYGAWCYLVVVDGTAFTVDETVSKIKTVTASYTTLSATSDVNMSGTVDINDAQLVYDIYNGKYEDFSAVAMRKFLYADANGDKQVNVTDAAAIVAAIQ